MHRNSCGESYVIAGIYLIICFRHRIPERSRRVHIPIKASKNCSAILVAKVMRLSASKMTIAFAKGPPSNKKTAGCFDSAQQSCIGSLSEVEGAISQLKIQELPLQFLWRKLHRLKPSRTSNAFASHFEEPCDEAIHMRFPFSSTSPFLVILIPSVS